MTLPAQYAWLGKEGAPKILVEALKLYGTLEAPGSKSNPQILAWADEIGGWIGQWYEDDSIPWCGLFIGVCAKRAGYPFTQKLLAAKEWASWGVAVTAASLGDVLVFGRTGGGHVGLYVGEDDEAYHVLGGNQSDAVTITRILKNRLIAARRSPFKVGQPTNVRRVFLKPSGDISKNEA